jgi:hypothetical protein
MAALFGTLVAVCGNGRCMLPGIFGDSREDLDLPTTYQVRPEPVVRSGR